ncbi:alcohol dehydrogenase catalytic domain-containing protein [Halomicroarcula sp. GCM10025709]|uniref:alcohol dehydrogenase catalytic domain-containing protein n=1 Tax=Haloarcula TaxID=2237 RepID=UPI0024C35E39|nr:alcohol dehydrogenase catalytic domain-containing protein [Halomicroarcula sp. YJ-61-S]
MPTTATEQSVRTETRMKAVAATEYGGPEVLRLTTASKPTPVPDEVLIRVRASTVGPANSAMREGRPFLVRFFSGLRRPTAIPGDAFAGEIAAVGRDVTHFAVGDRVFGTTAPESGTHAEYVCVPEDSTLELTPTGVSDAEAAAVADNGLTAMLFLQDVANLQPGQSILINGASGGIGTFAVQLATNVGAKVTGVCSTRNVDLVRSLGADAVVMAAETTSTTGNETFNSSQTVWVDFENERTRIERDTGSSELITVRNESGSVTYNVEDNSVNRYDFSFNRTQNGISNLLRLVDENETTFEGQERLDGDETYRLSFEPDTSEMTIPGSVDITVWFDTETSLPKQIHMVAESSEFSINVTQEYQRMSVDEQLSDDRFTIDIPADAEGPDSVEVNAEDSDSVEVDATSYESLPALRNNTTQDVPSPELPEPYSFDRGHLVEDGDETSVILRYTNGANETLSVSQHSTTDFNYSESERFDAVEFGDRTGWYSEFNSNDTTVSMLAWDCGDSRYTLSGSLTESEATDTAKAITCE